MLEEVSGRTPKSLYLRASSGRPAFSSSRCFRNMVRITCSEVPTQSLRKSTSAMRGMSAGRVAAKAMVASAVSPRKQAMARVGHGAAARPRPTSRPGRRWRRRRTRLLPNVLVEELHGDLVGVAVGGLHLVGVEARREEQELLAARRLQDLVHVGGHAAAPRQRPQRRRLQDGEVAVAAAHAHHGRDVQDVAVVGRLRAVVHRPDLHAVEGVDEPARLVEVARALARAWPGPCPRRPPRTRAGGAGTTASPPRWIPRPRCGGPPRGRRGRGRCRRSGSRRAASSASVRAMLMKYLSEYQPCRMRSTSSLNTDGGRRCRSKTLISD